MIQSSVCQPLSMLGQNWTASQHDILVQLTLIIYCHTSCWLQAPIFVEASEGPRISRPLQNSRFCYEHCRPANGKWSQCSSLSWHPSVAHLHEFCMCFPLARAAHSWINDLPVRVHDCLETKSWELQMPNRQQKADPPKDQKLTGHHVSWKRDATSWAWNVITRLMEDGDELLYHSHIFSHIYTYICIMFSCSMSSTPQDEFIRILELGDKLGERPSWEQS